MPLLLLVCAAAIPVLLFHHAVLAMAGDFRLELTYLVTGWSGYALIAAGLLLLVPVVRSSGHSPESWAYPRLRGAYKSWGISLYVMGLALAGQVSLVVG
jgi:hypothetical protein